MSSTDPESRVGGAASKFYLDIGGDSEQRKVPFWDWDEGTNAGYWWLDTQLQPGTRLLRACHALSRTPDV
eukprot:3594454-Rhodomonas_salina.2